MIGFRRNGIIGFGLLVLLWSAHLAKTYPGEPYFNNDEIRHTMSGVFFADALHDFPKSFQNPREYATNYYAQYPALGLLVWPPMFYMIEGMIMFVCGPSFFVARIVIGLFASVLLIATYQFARQSLPRYSAWAVAVLTSLAPLIFMYSERVMLEVPTLTLAMLAIVQFEKYLSQHRASSAILACTFTALALLTRFDAIFVPVYFALRLLQTYQWKVLCQWPVIVGICLLSVFVVPYYGFTFAEYGPGLQYAATQGTDSSAQAWYSWHNWSFYPQCLPEQLGRSLTVFGVFGLVTSLIRRQTESGPGIMLALAVYVTFSPLGELDSRHTMYWIPAWCVFAVYFCQQIGQLLGQWLHAYFIVFLIGFTAAHTNLEAFRYVRGYQAIAEFTIQQAETHRPIFVDGELSGSFVYHLRLADSPRQKWVLRADKLLYTMLSDPNAMYTQYSQTEAEVLQKLDEYDPEFVLLEYPQPWFHDVPGAELLAKTMQNHPELYELAKVVRIDTNYDHFEESSLFVYRKKYRNPNAISSIEIPMLSLGSKLTIQPK